MSYRITRFGTFAGDMTTLPVLEKTHDMGSGDSRLLSIDTPSGQYDLLGSKRAKRAPYTLPVSCKLYATTPASMQTQLDALKALRGKRDRLWMELYSGEFRWINARLVNINGMRNPKIALYQPLTLNFEITDQHWHGEHHAAITFDSGYYFDAGEYFDSGETYALDVSPKTLTINNGGNVTVDDVIMTITAQTTAITLLVIKRKIGAITYEHLVYTGSIAATESLVIDCGALSVKNDGAGDSEHFARGSDHKSDEWLLLEDGDNTIEVTRTGGGATSSIDFQFYDGQE